MKREYWNKVAGGYEDEIFSVLANDKKNLVPGALKKYGSAKKTVSDLGCGIGHFLPLLSDRFKKVIAVDISSKCISRAKKKYPDLSNISYMTADLASSKTRLPKVDVAFSVNSVLTPSLANRNRILDEVCRHIKRDGNLILVVPALESSLLSDVRLIEWNLRSGISPKFAAGTSFHAERGKAVNRHHEGVVPIEGVETKHYLKEELNVLLESRGMKVLNVQKIEYTWKSEFTDPPRWMKAPFPWDWLCTARKNS